MAIQNRPGFIETDVKISSSGSSAAMTNDIKTTFSTQGDFAPRIMIGADADVYVKIAASPTAAATDDGGFYLSGGSSIEVLVDPDHKIAAIRKGASGTAIVSISYIRS